MYKQSDKIENGPISNLGDTPNGLSSEVVEGGGEEERSELRLTGSHWTMMLVSPDIRLCDVDYSTADPDY